jgi:iron(III) transport system substrate-binding protein
MKKILVISLVTLALAAGCEHETQEPVADAAQDEAPRGPLVVYASHDAARTATVLSAYRSETGVRFQFLSDEMAEKETRLGNPRLMPEVDLFVAASIAELWAAAEADALRPTRSAVIAGNIIPALRDPESRWVALAIRARIVVYNSELVSEEKIASVKNYGSLGEEMWRDSLCVASSRVPGNRSLVAFLIRQHDLRQAEIIVRKWHDNHTASIFESDVELLQAIDAGECAVGIADSNVLASLKAARPETVVRPYWFDMPGNTMFDISGAGVTRHAADPDGATKLLEWLTTRDPNALFATGDFEFPANAEAQVGAAIALWSQYMTEPAPLADLGFLQEEADLLIERARYP